MTFRHTKRKKKQKHFHSHAHPHLTFSFHYLSKSALQQWEYLTANGFSGIEADKHVKLTVNVTLNVFNVNTTDAH